MQPQCNAVAVKKVNVLMILNINGIDHQVIVYVTDCFTCPMCLEPVCPLCKIHYAECECLGPTSEELAEYEHVIDYYDAVVTGYIKDERKILSNIH